MAGQHPPVGSGDLHVAVGQQLDLPPWLVEQVVMASATEKRVISPSFTRLRSLHSGEFDRATGTGEAGTLRAEDFLGELRSPSRQPMLAA